jgi:glycosyltransferase involved in cell wall biosynthesis
MNIWMLHPFAGGPDLGRHWRPYLLADAWTRLGHRSVVVSAAFHHLHQEPQAVGPKRIGQVDFWFVDTPRYVDSNLGRLRNNLAFGPRFGRDAVDIAARFGKPDLVIASSPHLFFIGAARRVARQFGAKFWVEIRDLWPDSIVGLGLIPAWHPLVKIIGWQERYAYRVADRVVSLLAGAQPHMKSRGLPAGRFVWVGNGVSDAEIRSASEPSKMAHPLVERIISLKTQGRKVVLYAGAMGPPNSIEVIIDAAAAMARTDPEICFLLIGSGTSRVQLEQRALNLPNVEFHDEVNRPIIHAMLVQSDCAVMALNGLPHYHHGISPNKLFDYFLFAPRTVFACERQALTGYEDLVTLRCEPDDPAVLARALVSALRHLERPLKQRLAIIQRFSYSDLAVKYLAEAAPSR